MKVLILTGKEVEDILSMSEIIDSIEEAFRLKALGKLICLRSHTYFLSNIKETLELCQLI